MALAVNACEALGSPGVGVPAFQDCGRPNRKKGEGRKRAGENDSLGSMRKGAWENG